MDEPGRWVTKAEAAQELEMSLSTLDRKIRKGEIEVLREGRRVYVRMHGPELMSDEELLERTIANLDESERTSSDWRWSENGTKARQAASGSRDAYEEVTEAYRKERRSEHGIKTRDLHAPRPVEGCIQVLLVHGLHNWPSGLALQGALPRCSRSTIPRC